MHVFCGGCLQFPILFSLNASTSKKFEHGIELGQLVSCHD